MTLYTNIRLNARLIKRTQVMIILAMITRPMGMMTTTMLAMIIRLR
ncbi:hypothetical protein [Pseudomonas abietaniphila]|nr:hypothetical protein [Pseudomonas abietaniphila]